MSSTWNAAGAPPDAPQNGTAGSNLPKLLSTSFETYLFGWIKINVVKLAIVLKLDF